MLAKINYLWRLFATGLSFVVFGVGGLFLGLIVIPLINVLPMKRETKRTAIRHLISTAFSLFFAMMHYLGILRLSIEGQDKAKNDKSCLVVANHPTLIDVVVLISMYPNACCIVKKQMWSNFFLKRVVSGADYIPNEDPEKLLENCEENLSRGDVLVIFPEGTRSVVGQEMNLQRGAAHIALRLNRPIRTIQIDVNPSTLTKNLPWYAIPARRVDFRVKLMDILSPQEILETGVPHSLGARRLTQKIRQNIDINLTKLA